jgi:hypothetical protein
MILNEKAPRRHVGGSIEDLMEVKGIGNRIDFHSRYNFKPELGGLSNFLVTLIIAYVFDPVASED